MDFPQFVRAARLAKTVSICREGVTGTTFCSVGVEIAEPLVWAGWAAPIYHNDRLLHLIWTGPERAIERLGLCFDRQEPAGGWEC